MFEASGVKNQIVAFAIAIGLLSIVSARADSEWITDYKKAQQEAKTNNKLLLIDFTGSDWCGYCIQFDRTILSQPQFKEYATKNLVLMEVDFPRRKAQPAETRKQNAELAQHYQIEGFPTVLVLNGDGRTVWRFDGYFSGSPEAFIAELEKARKG